MLLGILGLALMAAAGALVETIGATSPGKNGTIASGVTWTPTVRGVPCSLRIPTGLVRVR